MIIYSDLLLKPFLQNRENVNFIYTEDYSWDESINGENVLFVFSDYFRLYTKSNFEKIFAVVEKASMTNEVVVIEDLMFTHYSQNNKFNSVISSITKEDFDIQLGDYCQFPFSKSGCEKLELCIESWIRRVQKPILKAIFVDLDLTLIPGIWEEDKEKIIAAYQGPDGLAHRRLWRVIKKFHSHGSQVIVVSKNDKSSILEALEFIDPFYETYVTHVDYGWSPKGQRVSNLVARLNIGFSDCLFIDDNEVEIRSVKSLCKEIFVSNFKGISDLMYITENFLRGMDFKKRAESERNDWYNAILGQPQSNSGKVDIKYSVEYNRNSSLAFDRVKELSVKTNQMNFNKTQIMSQFDLSKYELYTLKVTTEFANLGIVGYAVLNLEDKVYENFVMSCRALGFGAEDDFMDFLLKNSGKFLFKKSEKNTVAENLINKYKENGRVIIQNL